MLLREYATTNLADVTLTMGTPQFTRLDHRQDPPSERGTTGYRDQTDDWGLTS